MRTTAVFSRICCAGLCSYADVVTGRVGVSDVFEMLLMLDWRDYLDRSARDAGSG
jgi:hypothetical protein